MTQSPTKEDTALPVVSKKSNRYTYSAMLVLLSITVGSTFYAIKITKQQPINELREQQTQITTLFHAATKTMSEENDTLKARLNTLDKQLQASLKQLNHPTDDSMFLKVRYYLELAQINAQWSDNSETTESLLQQADNLLSSSHDPRVTPIRQAIASEIMQLKTIPALDMTKVLSQLDAAVDTIKTLTLTSPKSLMTQTQTNNTIPAPNLSEWEHHLQQSLNVLKTMVVVRRQQENIQPLPSLEDETILRNRIELYLQDAQWAVIKHNDALYQWSLSQTVKHINQSFSKNDPKTKALVTQLETLQKIHLVPAKISLTESLPLLNQLIEKQS